MMSGVWGPGGLQGEGRLVWAENSITEGWFRDGCLHGLTRKIEIKKFRTFVQQVSGAELLVCETWRTITTC